MEVKRKKKGKIIFSTLYLVLISTWFVLTIILAFQNIKLKEQVSFEELKQGLCVYVEQDRWHDYIYCLVYDEYIDQIIEVDIFNEVVHCKIEVGDTIVYVVDSGYTDADFVNVIKAE